MIVFICVVMKKMRLRNALQSNPYIIHGTPNNPENRQSTLLIGLFGRQSLVTSAEQFTEFGLGLAIQVDALGRFFNVRRLLLQDAQFPNSHGSSCSLL